AGAGGPAGRAGGAAGAHARLARRTRGGRAGGLGAVGDEGPAQLAAPGGGRGARVGRRGGAGGAANAAAAPQAPGDLARAAGPRGAHAARRGARGDARVRGHRAKSLIRPRRAREGSRVDPRALADEDLMPLMSRGDARAFEVLYERHSSAAYSLAYRMVGTRIAAEDVTQDVFLSLWRSGARYDRARGSVRTWILGIVHHRAIDALRRATVHDRRRAGEEENEAAQERLVAPERTDVEAARREE